MGNDSFDDAWALPQLAGASIKMFSARTGAVEHLRRRNVVDRAAEGAGGVGVQVGEHAALSLGDGGAAARLLVVGSRNAVQISVNRFTV